MFSYDTLDQGWLVKFIEHRIADRRVVRLIQKWLKAGVLEEGKRVQSEVGTVQGGSISPLLSNIYELPCVGCPPGHIPRLQFQEGASAFQGRRSEEVGEPRWRARGCFVLHCPSSCGDFVV